MWEWWELRAKQPERCYGVTGTNGKSSTVYFLNQIWTHLKIPNYAQIGFGTQTWPDLGIGPIPKKGYKPLKKKLHELATHNVQRCCLECYSYNLRWGLLDCVKFSGAAFLNLSPEHLDVHASAAQYFAAKQRLFTELLSDDAPTVIGADCPSGRRLAESRKDPILFGRDPAYQLSFDTSHLHLFGHRYPVRDLGFPPVDAFLANLLAAVGLAAIDGIDISDVLPVLPLLRLPPGRVEKVLTLSNDRALYVDYAHNADGIEKILSFLRSSSGGRTIAIMSWKPRRVDFRDIHRVLDESADLTIITNFTEPNPRLHDLHAGLKNVLIIADRREAVTKAIELSQAGDTIVTGGGHVTFHDSLTGCELTDMELIRDVVQRNALA